MLKRKDLLLIALVIALAAVLLAVSQWLPKTDLSKKTADVTLAPDAIEYVTTPEPIEAPTAEPMKSPDVTETPAATEPAMVEMTAEPDAEAAGETAEKEAGETVMVGPMMPGKAEKVRGHVVLTVGGRQYGEPIAMDRDKIITLKQEDGKINKVHITPEKVYMEFSTCENQDCVGQGEVHVDTYKNRILGTYIICLPNNVSIEMVPAED